MAKKQDVFGIFADWPWQEFDLPDAKQGRSQTSEHDKASFERRRRESLGGSEGMSPHKMLKSRGSEMLL